MPLAGRTAHRASCATLKIQVLRSVRTGMWCADKVLFSVDYGSGSTHAHVGSRNLLPDVGWAVVTADV